MPIEEIDGESANQSSANGALNFKTIYEEEISLIERSGGSFDKTKDKCRSLAAICLSGGGIRSATFGLGCLQALDRKGLLRNFDYLSTVSGGGYIGSWLSVLLATKAPAPHKKPAIGGSLLSDKKATEALEFLRDNSSYLTPRNGIFSGDTWSLVAVYVRNLALNWLMILPLFAAVLTLPRILVHLPEARGGDFLFNAALVFGVLALIYPTVVPALPDVPEVPSSPTKAVTQNFKSAEFWRSVRRFWMEPKQFIWARLVPFALMILSLSVWYFAASQHSPPPAGIRSIAVAQNLAFWVFILPTGGFFAAGIIFSLLGYGTRQFPMNSIFAALVFALQSMASLSAIAVTLALAPSNNVFFFVWFPFLATMIFLGAHILFAGLTDPIVEDENREWWARSAGYFVMMAIGWSLLALVALVPPEYFDQLPAILHDPAKVGAAGLLSGAIAFVTRIENQAAAVQEGWAALGETSRKWIFSIALTLFVLILAAVLSSWTAALTKWVNSSFGLRSELSASALVVAVLFVFSYVFSIPVNINRFSAHAAYRNRLVRTFLGASNTPRFYNPFTGFSSKDNVYLHALARFPLQRDRRHAQQNRNALPSQRPFHVICGAANLASGERLAWQERKAVSFTFSGLHCGSFELGYRPSAKYGGSRGITLGTAMTISAAAVNSGMGFYSSPLKSFLLTLLNARLGWWLGNPSHPRSWKRDSPLVAFGPMLDELFSLTDAKAKFVNLSDGGHFDNTGVYEMLRRRCGSILLIDADTTLSGMTNLSLRARVDLNTDLERQSPTTNSKPFEEYKIKYPPLNGQNEFTGVLIRIFPQLDAQSNWCTFESLEYQRIHKDFPGTSLLDQFFTEGPFEAYRKLGQDIMGARIAYRSNQPDSSGLSLVF